MGRKTVGVALVGGGILAWYLLRGKSASAATKTEPSKAQPVSKLPSLQANECWVFNDRFDAFRDKDTGAIRLCFESTNGGPPFTPVLQSRCLGQNFSVAQCFDAITDRQFPSEDESIIPDKQEELFGLTIISV